MISHAADLLYPSVVLYTGRDNIMKTNEIWGILLRTKSITCNT